MTDPKDRDKQDLDPQSVIEAWREYGKRFTVFVPEYQPVPDIWEPDIPEYDDKGKTNPQYLKHWKFLQRTKDFLREHYGKYRILEGPPLYFDCLVPKFQDRMRHKWVRDQFDQPTGIEVNDSYAWYDKAIRMGLFGGEVGFSCRSSLCERHWCRLHRGNPHRLNPADIYGLVSVFENISLASAKSRVGKWWGVKLGDLIGKGVQELTRSRHKVSKKAISSILEQYSNMRAQHVASLIRDLRELIQASPLVEWHQRMFDDDHTFFSRRSR